MSFNVVDVFFSFLEVLSHALFLGGYCYQLESRVLNLADELLPLFNILYPVKIKF